MMKYYLVTETDGKYHIDYVSQKLVVAESLEDAFALTHGKPIDYVYTEVDARPPQRDMFKTEQGYKDSLRCHIQHRAETVKLMQEAHDSEVDWFKKRLSNSIFLVMRKIEELFKK